MVKDPALQLLQFFAKMSINLKNFKRYKIVYKYEVLGGLHTYLAKFQLNQEFPENLFYKYISADVYVGLSDEQALRLAQRHIQNAHIVHKITHCDLVPELSN